MQKSARSFVASIRALGAVLAACALAACVTAPAFGQGAILQGGPHTLGHAPMYTGSGSAGQTNVQDSGPAGGGAVGLGLSELLQVNRATPSGTGPFNAHNCLYSAPITSISGYYYLCLDAFAQGGGLIAFGSGGGAADVPFNFIINGVTYAFPFATNPGFYTTRTVSSGTTDAVTGNDYTVKWTSASASAKTQTIPACSAAIRGKTYVVADGIGTAGLYNIAVTPAAGTIGLLASQPLAISYGAMTLQCDGGSDWTLE